jgi:hypothetical protein
MATTNKRLPRVIPRVGCNHLKTRRERLVAYSFWQPLRRDA